MAASALKRRRGNTYADELTVTSEKTGAVIDITGHSFVMHVTTDKAPDSLDTNLLYSITGTILDAPAGRVEFAPTLAQATQPDGVYYYEVILTDGAGRTRTIALEKYTYY